MFNYRTVAGKILLQIRESFQGHPTRIITYLVVRLCESLASWFVSDHILTMDIKRLPQGESLVHLLLTADLSILISFQKVSVHHNESSGQEYIKSHKDKLCMVSLLCELFASI